MPSKPFDVLPIHAVVAERKKRNDGFVYILNDSKICHLHLGLLDNGNDSSGGT